jgi:hypothetical protein
MFACLRATETHVDMSERYGNTCLHVCDRYNDTTVSAWLDYICTPPANATAMSCKGAGRHQVISVRSELCTHCHSRTHLWRYHPRFDNTYFVNAFVPQVHFDNNQTLTRKVYDMFPQHTFTHSSSALVVADPRVFSLPHIILPTLWSRATFNQCTVAISAASSQASGGPRCGVVAHRFC